MLNMQKSNGENVSSKEDETMMFHRLVTPQEEALQSFCKHLLKSKLFRGFYIERRFVNALNDYRDIIALQRSEKELEKLLLDITKRLEMFYAHTSTPNIWIGLTHGPLIDANLQAGALETYLWVELDELAFGQYWFSIKSVRFRQNEILLKLKVVRAVEDESKFMTPVRTRKSIEIPATTAPATATNQSTTASANHRQQIATTTEQQQINFQDFVEIFKNWGLAVQHTIYDFMAHDINKENLKSLLRLFGLLLLSLVSGSIAGIKFLGIFTLRFMYEFSRLTHVLTPILLKLIEVLNKMIGGFYILIAMIWRDTFGKLLGAAPAPARTNYHEIAYNQPLYRAIKYDVGQKNHKKFD